MSASRKLRMGQIGCNGVAHNHASAHSRTGNTELVAVCDIDEARARAFAEKYSVPHAATDAAELFSREDIDAIDIVTPDATHAELAVGAANAGKHVLIEKPFATSLEEADAIGTAAKQANVKAMCAQSMRWEPKVAAFVEAVHDGRIGEVVFGRYWGGCPRFWSAGQYPTPAASTDPRAYLLLRNGMHWMDLLCWMLDDIPASVYTIGHPGEDDVPLWEYTVVNLAFARGATALAEDNRMIQPAGYPTPGLGLYAVGTDGTLSIEPTRDLAACLINSAGTTYPGSHVYKAPMDDNFTGELRDFAHSVLHDAPVPIPLAHSRRVLAAVLTACESLKTGRPEEVRDV